MPSDIDDLYSAAIAEAYARAPADVVILETIEIRHITIVDDDGNPSALRFINDYGDRASDDDPEVRVTSLGLEVGAPLNPGETVTFIACRFDITLAAQEQGAVPVMAVSIDGVASEVSDRLDRAVEVGSPMYLTYRQYLASDKTAPQVVQGNAKINRITSNLTRVSAQAGYTDMMNATVPGKLCRPNEYPGLAP